MDCANESISLNFSNYKQNLALPPTKKNQTATHRKNTR